ncbi:MAG TPA: F0F1 ATP synthase subunit epsilon [Firmicutes bacterium]|jgi:F-type H+-transporting ATPase subunit epsilon|nr:F0F1 ATP synthase subunit epsilon [Bacillota bacterium]
MPGQIKLEIYTPSRQVLNTRTEYVALPCESGELGVMYNHRPMIVGLTIGVLRYGVPNGPQENVFVSGGFAEVRDNQVTVLADVSELAEEIDAARAMEARDQAERRLRQSLSANDLVRSELALKRALTRLKIVKKLH